MWPWDPPVMRGALKAHHSVLDRSACTNMAAAWRRQAGPTTHGPAAAHLVHAHADKHNLLAAVAEGRLRVKVLRGRGQQTPALRFMLHKS